MRREVSWECSKSEVVVELGDALVLGWKFLLKNKYHA